ncbi:rifampicin phosphotransferase-like [Littorina saxatilis]|uniref:Phosphoenolpyruvate synthase n=1 Tax=Littorina saxatilis TaxID=31220 RepID=A0AAN9BZF5_9CAEN
MISAAAAVGIGALGVLLFWLLKPNPPLICGVYPQPGRWYWIKRAVFAVMFRRRKAEKRKQESSRMNARGQEARGLGRSLNPFDMECCQSLPDHPHALDAVYMGAYSCGDGPNVALRVARRPGRRAEVWLVLQVPGVGRLQHPGHPDTAVANADPSSFSAGGLRFDVVHPMKTWRVSFSGQLRLQSSGGIQKTSEKLLDTKFSFQWDAFAPHFNYDSDLDPGLLGDAIAREQWSREYFEKLQSKHQTHYEQWGELRGTLTVEGHPTQQLRLKAIRDHSFGVRRWTDFYRYVFCFLYIENGTTLQIGAVSQPGMLSHLKTGCLTYPTGEVAAVTEVNFNLWEVGEDPPQPPAKWSFSFVADGVQYELAVMTKTSAILYHEEDRGGIVHETFCDVVLNGKKGWGLSEFFYRNPVRSKIELEATLPLLEEPDWGEVKNSKDKLILPFTSLACCSSALVGGKGSQLALLTQMSQEEDVSVPPGLCVTLTAFEQQMKEHKELQEAIQRVADTAVKDPAKLEAVCKETSALLCATPVCSQVQRSVREGLRQVFGDDVGTKRVAVRSSAAGEDGSEASSAGQMETFLGVLGEGEIFQALQKCWASAFTYQAVEYKRQHGQIVLTPVGVVIQEMVPAEAAGVLFTADPVTNNVSIMLINANFGLGESVVSGKCEPDTITIRRAWDVGLSISQRHVGQKKTKITMQDGGGIAEVELSGADSKQNCLSDDVILSLAKTGLQIEKYFGTPRDIEWAYAEGKIHLLQARPITTSDQETEDELIHEFDSPLAGGYEWLTTGNISEMMPGAVTPLTISTFHRSIDRSMQCFSRGIGARQQVVDYRKALTSWGNHLFISLIDVTLMLLRISVASKDTMEMSLLGEKRPDLHLDVSVDYLGKPPPGRLTCVWNSVRMFWYLHKATGMTKMWEKRLENYSLVDNCTTASQVYAAIDQHVKDFDDVWHWTLTNSANSGSWANILINIITKGSTDWTTEHYGDIAMLLSQCQDVCSAEVPGAMQELAEQVVAEGLKDTFLSSTSEECVGLLLSHKHPVLQQKTQTFLKRHGHRCVREAEMREKSWHLEPTKLVGVLKAIMETGGQKKVQRKAKTPKELVADMKTPLTFVQRHILQYLLPKAWAAVASREWGKSVSVLMNDIFKAAYWKLATLMVKEGRLPDEDVLFFLTHYEIAVLLATRSARLVMKAQRRRKVLPKQMALRFPKISIGYPKPLEVQDRKISNSKAAATTLTGMPVSQGVVVGPARIVLSLDDAHMIQAGEVLVVNSTDVGWSPYFPLIGGLVTEIGGLISHGAVVAREYGIPCIVNIADATVNIPNGAQVEVDGRAGTVKILS